MSIQLGVVMDPIGSIHYHKDSTLALLWEAKARGWTIHYFEPQHLFLRDGVPYGNARLLDVRRDEQRWFSFQGEKELPLAELDVILMRKDPPFDEKYIVITYLLEHAERRGVLIVNRPEALRDANEKVFATYFPQCTPPTLVTSSIEKLNAFWETHRDMVCKPLHGMGGTSVFRLKEADVNAPVIFETLTHGGTRYIMAQRFIPEIREGDKRILLIDGEPISHALARVPQGNDWRGNLAVGARGRVQPLTDRDRWICTEVGPELKKRGLYFVGLDVIGDYLTEINVTSPTCIRELDAGIGPTSNISARVLEGVERRLV